MEKNKIRRVTFLCTDVTIEQLDHIATVIGTRLLNGRTDLSATIRATIAQMYEKKMPTSMKIELAKQARMGASPEEAAAIKVRQEELKEQLKADKERQGYEAICNTLDRSTIIDHPLTGRPACQYPMFMAVSPHKIDERIVTEELDTLTKETPLLQYRGLLGETGIEGKQSVVKILAKQAKLNK